MANFEYKNIDEILQTTLPIRGVRVSLEDNKLLEKVPYSTPINPPDPKKWNFEFHTFLPNGAYISSIYNIESWKIDNSNIGLDIHRDMRFAGNTPGVYKIVYNFFRNLIGTYESPNKLFISDISPDRSELKLSLINPDSEQAQAQLKLFVLRYIDPRQDTIPSVVLNFGENKIANIINVTSDGSKNSFYVKLYEPLPADLTTFFECWVSEEIMRPYIETVNYIGEAVPIQLNKLKGPNFEVDYDYWVNSETDYKSWNDILSANVQTSQEILDRYISSSNLPVQLNVNFREFENFVFYSSAEERVNNFVYKMELVERYNNEIALLDTYTGSISANKIKVKNLKDKTITGFDSFEKWLYYETTGSNYYTSQASASIVPYPKYEVTSSDYNIATKEGKYKFYTSGSNEVDEWYSKTIDIATDYDLKNYNALNKAIPEYLRDDRDNEQFVTFINMVGHHFDVLYLYTDHIIKKNLREEHPKDGMSQDLIYDVAKNLGWTLSHGTQAKDLWEYALGVSGSGDPIWTGKTTVNKYLSKTEEERTKEVWRRVLNNLPYIYKSKGTGRGIKALLSAYGIPQTLLTIREYGGPDNADLGIIPRAEWEKHTYFLNFSGSFPLPTTQQYVSVPWEKVQNSKDIWQYPDTVTFRWKMEPNDTYGYTNDPEQTLLQKNTGNRVDWYVTVNKNGTDVEKGSIYFHIGDGTNYFSASIEDEYLYDDIPLNLMIRRRLTSDSSSAEQQYDFFVKTNKYGKIAVERSASVIVSGSLYPNINRAWVSDGTLFIGSGSNPKTDKILSGSIYELRYWVNPLTESSFNNHVLAARAYNGNFDTSSFYDLQAQFKFWQKFDVAVTTSLSSSHPDQTKTQFLTSPKAANFVGFNSDAFESIVETYNMEVATLGNNTIYTEKVRIDSGSLIGGLDMNVSSEVSAFDRFSVDSNKLMVAFSPQHVINEDIYESIGGAEIDDYIGDYSNIMAGEYTDLKWLSRDYWKKYPNKNDFNTYIDLISVFDFSVFDQIRQTLPARANPILGLVVEPNILERSKVGNIGRNFTAEPNNVFESNDLTSSASPRMDYISNATSIQMIGFDIVDGDLGNNIEGESDIPNKTIKTTISKDKLGIVTGSVSPILVYNNVDSSITNPQPNTKLDYLTKETSIVDNSSPVTVITYTSKELNLINNKPILPQVSINQNTTPIQTPVPELQNEFLNLNSQLGIQTENLESNVNQYNTTLSDVLTNKLENDISLIRATVSNREGDRIFSVSSEVNSLQNYGTIFIEATNTYNRVNFYKTGSSDNLGYGTGWVTSSNTTNNKSLVFGDIIETPRQDNFYRAFYLYYSSSLDILANNFYSASLTSSKSVNQENIAIGLQNYRFRGSKLIGPDINVNTTNTPDGKPVVEVLIVGSTQIVYNTYFSNRSNLIPI